MMKEIYFKEDLDKLYLGIQKICDAVSSTMGPNGRTVIITDEYGKPFVTKDGVSVARRVNFKDPVENIGAHLVKEVCELQVKLAGDGTTTAIVLANALIQNLKTFDYNEVIKALDVIIPKIIDKLKENSRELKYEDIKYVASISANNDIQIGDIIQQAYNHASIVKVEESNNLADSLELVNGMSLPVSYFSKHFITNPNKGECELDTPFVLIIDGKLDNLKPFEESIKQIAASKKPLLIIVEGISDSILRLLETNVINDALKVCVIKSPGFSQHRKDLLSDIAKFTNGTVIKDLNKSYSIINFGLLQSANINKNNTILVKLSGVNNDEFISSLKEQLKTKGLTETDKDLLLQRIEHLEGKISIISVGGGSEIEMKERKDRYDDAVLAVACALEEGIVEGGGLALLRETIFYGTSFTDIEKGIYKSLAEPCFTIERNSNISFKLENDLFKQNIIDPLKVTRCALENAVSIARTILSTNTIILNENQWT